VLRALIAPLAFVLGLSAATAAARAEGAVEVWRGIYWGEPSAGLLRHFGSRATVLPRPIDFGDSYVDVVLRNVAVGGVMLIAYFQMDKTTGGLKRIQLERPRHAVTPPAFRGVLAGLEAAFGPPDVLCGIRPGPATGYQAAAERIWQRDGAVIRALFRDTTIEAFEGCAFGPCGLTGQLLIRISPAGGDAARCPAPPLGERRSSRPDSPLRRELAAELAALVLVGVDVDVALAGLQIGQLRIGHRAGPGDGAGAGIAERHRHAGIGAGGGAAMDMRRGCRTAEPGIIDTPG
jgi:hypothetical protein